MTDTQSRVEEICTEYLGYAYAVAKRQARPGDDPDDVRSAAHSGLVVAARTARPDASQAELKAYIASYVNREVRNVTARRVRRASLASNLGPAPLDLLPAREQFTPVEVLVPRLSGVHREVAVAVIVEQRTIREVAADRGVSPMTVHNLLAEAREMLVSVADDYIGGSYE